MHELDSLVREMHELGERSNKVVSRWIRPQTEDELMNERKLEVQLAKMYNLGIGCLYTKYEKNTHEITTRADKLLYDMITKKYDLYNRKGSNKSVVHNSTNNANESSSMQGKSAVCRNKRPVNFMEMYSFKKKKKRKEF